MTHWLIVGGGTAGCVLASRLSENMADHVTMIEAGPERASSSASYLDDLAAAGALWDGLAAFDGEGVARPYPQGRGVGGSSAVNGGVLSMAHNDSHRPEILIGADVPSEAELGTVDRALLAATDDAAIASLARRGGRRLSTANTYLAAARGRRNLDVVTNSVVDRVLLAGGRAAGVALINGSVIEADRVVCAAGAVYTPTLLLRSGVDAPGVGEGLRDHVGRVVELALDDSGVVDPHGLVTGVVLRRGVIEVVAMNHLGPARPGHAALLVGLLANQRRGAVRLNAQRPDDPMAAPDVDFGRLGDADTVRLASGVEMVEELLTTAPFADVVADARVLDGFGGYAHATSTCAMGTVVDEHCAVVGYEDLFVADASVLPATPPSGTYLPVVLLAERLANAWRQR